MRATPPARPVVFYSPPLRRVSGQSVSWTYETVLVGADGSVQLLDDARLWSSEAGRAECARHVVAQVRVDREAARASGADVGVVGIVDASSWDDLKRSFALPTRP